MPIMEEPRRKITLTPVNSAKPYRYEDVQRLTEQDKSWFERFAAFGNLYEIHDRVRILASARPILQTGIEEYVDVRVSRPAYQTLETMAAYEGYFDTSQNCPDVKRLLHEMGTNKDKFWSRSSLGKTLTLSSHCMEEHAKLKEQLKVLNEQCMQLKQRQRQHDKEVKELNAAIKKLTSKTSLAKFTRIPGSKESEIKFDSAATLTNEQLNKLVEEIKPYFDQFKTTAQDILNIQEGCEETRDELFFCALAYMTYTRPKGVNDYSIT
ncbi:hypothetical protein GUITHDRAFT_105445 [Guillardia theta CCMP2712]|uniref:Uncharacterized protein n=1 Tax=Guillardia theta (strain CCMP2712) TaxID=905079 RepID=L1JL08_GUITC|nr:hypothetical protein GUITHDRAFT_105445 [Guillardia theta CCMP2712]EKX48819.1 hypothetical protein GUITHDRAFT_105445 [Guillardia theta CCMP2712]|eukprot:XP_005835799.1 hypothetical protein GUITHDRAFT_105445 [Guillardia theta CCMP2712]